MAASNHEQRRHRRRARDSFSREAITNSTIAAPSLAVETDHRVVRAGTSLLGGAIAPPAGDRSSEKMT